MFEPEKLEQTLCLSDVNEVDSFFFVFISFHFISFQFDESHLREITDEVNHVLGTVIIRPVLFF